MSHWYVAARSDQVTDTPLAAQLLRHKIVLFRTQSGRVVALEDRCPHKNVALSLGRVLDDRIQCRYHGWEFTPEGKCVNVPCSAPNEPLPQCKIKTYDLVEQDDWIWIWTSQTEKPAQQPPRYPKDKKYYWFEMQSKIKAPMELILDNGVDCSHTGFVHPGLFRSTPGQFVDVQIIERENSVQFVTSGEQNNKKRDIRSLLSGGAEIHHTDEYIFPHTVKVDYHMGKSHILTILTCTPIDEETTLVFTRMAVLYPFGTSIIGRFVEHITKKVVKQDKEVLESQAVTIAAFNGKNFCQTIADWPARILSQKLAQLNLKEAPENKPRFIPKHVSYKL